MQATMETALIACMFANISFYADSLGIPGLRNPTDQHASRLHVQIGMPADFSGQKATSAPTGKRSQSRFSALS